MTVRQTPAIATESPIVSLGAGLDDEPRAVEGRNRSHLTHDPREHRPRLRLAQVRLDEDVFARRLRAEVEQFERLRELAEHEGAVTGEDRGDEEEELVDEPGFDERGRDRPAAFEEERLHTVGAERR